MFYQLGVSTMMIIAVDMLLLPRDTDNGIGILNKSHDSVCSNWKIQNKYFNSYWSRKAIGDF